MSWALVVMGGIGAASVAWGGNKESKVEISPDAQSAINRLMKLSKADVSFPTRQVQGETSLERFMRSMSIDFARSGTDPALQTAIDEATKTATGPIDITKMPEFKGIFDKILEGGRLDAQSIARSLQLSGGGSFGSPDRDILGRSVTGTQERLTAAMAGLFSQLRGLKVGAVGQLGSFGAQREASQISKIGVGSQAAFMERQIQQMINDAQFQKEINEIQMKYVTQPSYLSTVISGSPINITGGGPTDFSKFLSGFSAASSAFGAFGGGGTPQQPASPQQPGSPFGAGQGGTISSPTQTYGSYGQNFGV